MMAAVYYLARSLSQLTGRKLADGSVLIDSVEEPQAIRAILAYFAHYGALEKAHYRPVARAPHAVAA